MTARRVSFVLLSCSFLTFIYLFPQSYSPLTDLARVPNYETHRISSHDLAGGNSDLLRLKPGETKVLAEIEGPGAITHFWNTINAEKYYPRMLILRFYWDGQATPSVEVPVGDFFAVGHGLDRTVTSFPVAVSSKGIARNCYWFMPFRKSAKVTVTHEGFQTVEAFYYYIDYRRYQALPDDLLYFHAQYRQATPNPKVDLGGKNLDGRHNYVLMETTGHGQYVGTVLSVQNNRDGWFGEGDDMFHIDGASFPQIVGTGTEDYFNDAWGFREFTYPYYGVTLWEGYQKGDRGSAYKWHIFDPIAFTKSLRASIEHGHANDRTDDWYSVAFWYQDLPSPPFPVLPPVMERLPDEGQIYVKSMALSKQLSALLTSRQYETAISELARFETENPRANDFGWCSLWRGVLNKHLGRLEDAQSALQSALQMSQPSGNNKKAEERDAGFIGWLAKRELPILQNGASAWIYAVSDEEYELYLDGKLVGKGRGGPRIEDFEIQELKPGRHVVGAKLRNKKVGAAHFSLVLSHAKGYVKTDGSWKVSETAGEDWNQGNGWSKWDQAQSVGLLAEQGWPVIGLGLPSFLAPLLSSEMIWTPGGERQNQKLYTVKEFVLED